MNVKIAGAFSCCNGNLSISARLIQRFHSAREETGPKQPMVKGALSCTITLPLHLNQV